MELLHEKAEQQSRLESASMRDLDAWGDLDGWSAPQQIDASILKSIQRCQAFLKEKDEGVYGVHTGFGSDVSAEARGTAEQHQALLLKFLNVGCGSFLPDRVVRRALRLQIEKTRLGLSGLSVETFQTLLALQGASKLPKVPRYGSLGASGDLIPMAHAVKPLFKEGVPGPRDVLSLVNTNSMMTSLAIELFGTVERLWSEAVLYTAKASTAAGFGARHFGEKGLAAASSPDNPEVAEVGALLRTAVEACDLGVADNQEVQARYSLRCAPMVLGACLWSLRRAEERLLWEARRVADNPLVLDDGFFHGAHFYAIGIAQAVDCLSDVVGRLCEMLDRQVLTLMDPRLSGLPRNLENEKDHCKGLSQLISALYQRLRGMMVPSRALSFSCEGNNQDIVPCGMSALLSLSDQLEVAGHAFAAARFCIDRALTLKADQVVPPELHLESWRGDLGH